MLRSKVSECTSDRPFCAAFAGLVRLDMINVVASAKHLHRRRANKSRHLIHRLVKNNSILGGEFVDILNGNRRILIRSLQLALRGGGRIVRCREGGCHNEFLEA